MIKKRVTDKRLIGLVEELLLVDGYPPTSQDIVDSLRLFEKELVVKALERAKNRGKLILRDRRWYPSSVYR